MKPHHHNPNHHQAIQSGSENGALLTIPAGPGSVSKHIDREVQRLLRYPLRSRHELLTMIAQEFPPEIFLSHETVMLLFGNLWAAKRVVESARLRLWMKQYGVYSLPQAEQMGHVLPPPRPIHTLSRLNRSSIVYPPLVGPQIQLKSLRVGDILEIVREQSALKVPPHCLVDLLVSAGQLSWEAAAQLLLRSDIITRPFDVYDLDYTRRAREFWNFYAAARVGFRVLVQSNQLPLWPGDWALFAHMELESLLPAVVLPDHCRRSQYVTNYLHQVDEACLDLYSATMLPLVRHPFPTRFNPLVFGKPRPLPLTNGYSCG